MASDIQDQERQRVFARNLREVRRRAGLTQAGMAEKLDMLDEIYARYERAKMWPSLDKLCRMCDILGCSADTLLGTNEALPIPSERPEDPPAVRRLMRKLRKAEPMTVHLATRMVDVVAKHEAMKQDGADRES